MRTQSVIPPVKYASLNEGQLWDCFRKGEKAAFDLIYQRHAGLLYNYGIRINPDSLVVEDCLQDLFVEIWEKRSRLGPTDSIKYYLFKSLRRKMIRRQQNEARLYQRLSCRPAADFEIVFSHEQELMDRQSSEERRRTLSRAIELLSRRQKEAIFLKYFEGLSYDRIASVMSIHTNAVYKLICAAIKTLRKALHGSFFAALLLYLFR